MTNVDYGLKGRTALITGATGGIGSAIATTMYKLGTNLVISGRDLTRLNALRDTIYNTIDTQIKNQSIICIPMDLTAINAETTLIQRTMEQTERLDILINNAGMVDGQMFLKTKPLFLDQIMHTNFTAPYKLAQAALPYMLKNKYGRIICITSVAGIVGDAGMSAYAASKGALASATKSIATEYGRRNITANCVAPGIIETAEIKKISAAYQRQIKENIPSRRFGTPDDVANLVAFLASELASYINGQQISVNGGLIR